MSKEPDDDQSRRQREITAKAVSAAQAAIRREIAAVEQAARDGTLEKYLQDKRDRGNDAARN
jgi:hypothetical protein